jgi:hypothetical protein
MVSLAWENNATGRIFTVQNPDFVPDRESNRLPFNML